MFFAVIGVVLLGILWGLIVSRGFRIFAVLLAAVGLFWGMAESDKAARTAALRIYEKLLLVEPGNGEANYQAAVLLMWEQNYQRSLEHLARTRRSPQAKG